MLLLFALIAGSSSLWAVDVTGTINFGNASGSTQIKGNSSSGTGTVTYTDTGKDSQGNTWTITTVTSNDKSFTQNSAYSQVGASSKPVTSITFTTTLPASQTIKAFSAKFGGFSNTAGDITLKVGDTSVGTGALNATTDVTVSATNTSTAGTVLTVTVTNIAKGVKCYNISYTYDDGTVPPSVVAPTSNIETGVYVEAKDVTLSCETPGAEIYYSLDKSEPTSASTKYTDAINVASTTTIKAIAVKDAVSSSVIEVTITIPTTTYHNLGEVITAGATTDPFILDLTDAQVLGAGNNDIYVKDASDALDFYKLGLSYTAGQMLNGKVAVTNYTVYNGMPEITGIGENKIVASAGTLPTPTVLANASDATLENYKWKIVTVTGTATAGKKIDDLALYTNLLSFSNFIANVDNVTATGLIIPYKNGENPVVPELLPTSIIYNITLSKDMVTYCSTNKLDFSGTGLKVYSAKVENGVAALTEIENAIVTKEKGLILSGTAEQTYNVPVTAANATGITTELVGVTAETAVAYSADSKYNYILQNGVFKKATGDKLKAGKAYLSTTYDVTAAGAPGLEIVFDGETTGIADVRSKMEDVRGDFFDLQGRKVAQPSKGLYIVNGRKVIVK